MRIEIVDGAKLVQPHYSNALSPERYLKHLDYVTAHTKHVTDLDPKVHRALQQDFHINRLLANAIALGPGNSQSWLFERFSGALATRLAEDNDILELVDKRQPRQTNHEVPPSPPLTGLHEARQAFDNRVYLGENVRKGTLYFEGQADEVTSAGGTVHVKGDVKRVKAQSGIVYIDGNVQLLRASDKGIAIVNGQVDRFELPYGNFPDLTPPSPYIFLKEKPTHNQMARTKVHPSQLGFKDLVGYFTVLEDPQHLSNWNPRDTLAAALALCREKNVTYAKELAKIADQEPKTPQDIAKFAEAFLVPYYHGKSAGFGNGLRSAPSHWSDD